MHIEHFADAIHSSSVVGKPSLHGIGQSVKALGQMSLRLGLAPINIGNQYYFHFSRSNV